MDEERRARSRRAEAEASDPLAQHRLRLAEARDGNAIAQWETDHITKLQQWVDAALARLQQELPLDFPMTRADVIEAFLAAYQDVPPETVHGAGARVSVQCITKGGRAPRSHLALVVSRMDVTVLGLAVSDNGTPGGAWFSLRPINGRIPAKEHYDAWALEMADKSRMFSTLTEFYVHWAEILK